MDGREQLRLGVFVFQCFILVFGVIGNIISFIVWTYGRRCRPLPVSTFFRFLAAVDTFILVVPGVELLLYLPPLELLLRNQNVVMCKALVFVTTSCLRISSWTLVILSMKKAVRIYLPLTLQRSSIFGIKWHTRVALAFITLLSLSMNIPNTINSTIVEPGNVNQPINSTDNNETTSDYLPQSTTHAGLTTAKITTLTDNKSYTRSTDMSMFFIESTTASTGRNPLTTNPEIDENSSSMTKYVTESSSSTEYTSGTTTDAVKSQVTPNETTTDAAVTEVTRFSFSLATEMASSESAIISYGIDTTNQESEVTTLSTHGSRVPGENDATNESGSSGPTSEPTTISQESKGCKDCTSPSANSKNIFNGPYCNYIPSQLEIFLDITLIFFVPFTIFLICNTLILIRLCRRGGLSMGINKTQQSKRKTDLRNMVYHVIGLCIVHTVSTAPWSIWSIYRLYHVGEDVFDHYFSVYDLLNAFGYLNSAVNVVLYCAIGADFRNDFKHIFCSTRREASTSTKTLEGTIVKEKETSSAQSISTYL